MNEFLLLPLIALGLLALWVAWILNKIGGSADRHPAGPSASKEKFTKSSIICAGLSGLIGLGLRLYGFDRSLWLDEFGTLWTVEGSIAQLLDRVYVFQGQSPLYYLFPWSLVHSLGESEIALRLGSLIFGLAAAYGIFQLGSIIYGRNAGLISASFLWLSPVAVQMDAQARPYSLALLMAVFLIYGFARAASNGDRLGRWLFVFGGVGLFFAQYVLVLMAVGVALGYFYISRLKFQYPWRQFAADTGIQVLLGSLGLPHVIALWQRRASLSWMGPPNYLSFFEVIGPSIVLALAPFLIRVREREDSFALAMTKLLWAALAVHLVILHGAAYFGINLLEPRYMVVSIVPAILLAAAACVKLPLYFTAAPLCFWFFFSAAAFLINLNAYGSFSRAGFQDWKNAVACLDGRIRTEPEAIVLYRSGFVEEDGWMGGEAAAADRAPLRSPARSPAAWNLIRLTYRWDKAGRENYFAGVVEPALSRAPVAYFLTCARCFNAATGEYPKELADWIDKKFFGSFERKPIAAGQGITLIRFAKKTAGSNSAEAGQTQSRMANEASAQSPGECRQEP